MGILVGIHGALVMRALHLANTDLESVPCPYRFRASRCCLMQLSPEEQQAIVKSFSNPDDVRAHGVRLAGQKFFVISANDRSIYGKKGVRYVCDSPSFASLIWAIPVAVCATRVTALCSSRLSKLC